MVVSYQYPISTWERVAMAPGQRALGLGVIRTHDPLITRRELEPLHHFHAPTAIMKLNIMDSMMKRESSVVTSHYLATQQEISKLPKSIDNLRASMVQDNTDDYSPLQMAVMNGHLDKVKSLVSQGANVNQGTAEGWTPLMIAAKTGRVELLTFLIGQGAEITKSVTRLTALHFAALLGHLDAIKYLISQGADVKEGNENGWTAFHIAAFSGHFDVIKYLISQGAEINRGNNNGGTALHYVALSGHLDITKYLISQGAEVKKGDNDGWTALHFAALNGHLDVTKHLISQGAEVKKGENDGWTALHTAVHNGHLDVTKHLISQGAEVNKGDNNGWTALHFAAHNGNLDVTKYLISQGAEVNKGDNDGWTALHFAAHNGNLDVIKYLISQGAEVNKGDNNSWTALHLSAHNGHLDVTKYLVSQGAEVNIKNENGWKSSNFALLRNHIDVVKFLKTEGASIDEEILHQQKHLRLLFPLMIMAKRLNTAFNTEDIHLAIQNGQTTTIENLVSQGADLNVQSADGQMCLHEAIKLCYKTGRNVEESYTLRKISDEFYNGNLSPEKALVFYLLDNGAKTDVEDKSGKLPIHYAEDEVVRQMILSRMKSHPEEAHYYQESVNKERHKESEVSAAATLEDVTMSQNDKRDQTAEIDEGHTDEEYDLIQIEKHGITVRISKYEIYSAKDITVEVIEEVPLELKLKETEAIISVGLKMSPSDAMFDSPVRVTMPHCGAFTKPTDAEVYIYYRKNDSTKFTAILSTSTRIPKCVVRDRDLDIYLEPFSEFWIIATIRKIFIGKVIICTPIIPVPAPRNPMPVVWVNVRDQNTEEEQIPEEYKAPIPEEQFLFRWRSGGLKISCKESTLKDEPQILQEREFRHLNKHKKMFEVDTQNITENAVNLHITLQQNTTKNTLIVPMSLKATVISEGGACSPSTIATSSSSADNHPVETIGSASTSETRAPREESEKDFDGILRKIAKQVNKMQDVDELGCELEFQPSEIESYLENNRNGSYMGTLQMLRAWVKRKKMILNKRELLRQALIDIDNVRLADELLGVDKQ
ncbi:serine/threonine-protein phosphatase 6 regulatory ankyrin repeat subunit B-like [Lytechinus pictus]|uniref:serine/threonine-protein phosphatase 6 regulatory ankyrin repeat subunit B-like n=1 Tax=Lytechinus pictus TaxID=7653 RepID=UPI0030B9B5E5